METGNDNVIYFANAAAKIEKECVLIPIKYFLFEITRLY